MAQLEQLLHQIAITVAGLVAPLAVILREMTVVTRETVPYHTTNQVDAIANQLNDPTHGLAAIQSQLATFQATTALDFTAVLTAVAAAQQTGSPVTLPATPPTGYGFDATTDVAAIWAYVDPVVGNPMSYEVGFTYEFATGQADDIVSIDRNSAYFATRVDPQQHYLVGDGPHYPPVFNLSALARSDTVLSILTASNPFLLFSLMSDGQHYHAFAGSPYDWETVCLVDDAWLEALKTAVLGPLGGTLAPIWPGLTGVTLGTAVALSNGLVLPGPLSGVIVIVTSVPTPISYYPFGTIKSYVRGGALLFTDDNGDSEFPQPFGPDHQVILPKSMESASSATVRLPSGIVGTIQPFTIP